MDRLHPVSVSEFKIHKLSITQTSPKDLKGTLDDKDPDQRPVSSDRESSVRDWHWIKHWEAKKKLRQEMCSYKNEVYKTETD